MFINVIARHIKQFCYTHYHSCWVIEYIVVQILLQNWHWNVIKIIFYVSKSNKDFKKIIEFDIFADYALARISLLFSKHCKLQVLQMSFKFISIFNVFAIHEITTSLQIIIFCELFMSNTSAVAIKIFVAEIIGIKYIIFANCT